MHRLLIVALALLLTATPAMAQSSAGNSGGSGSGGGGPATQSGTWNVGLTGTLPAFAATPTFNVGTIAGIATETGVQAVRTTLGSPFQAGGSIGNTAFGISGTLPAFAATPTFNLGALNGAATASNQASEITLLQTAAQRSLVFTDLQGTATTANGLTSGPIHDLGAAPAYSRMNLGIYSTQAGTLILMACVDSSCSLPVTVAQVAVAAGANATLNAPVLARYWRGQFLNGATAGAVNMLASATAN